MEGFFGSQMRLSFQQGSASLLRLWTFRKIISRAHVVYIESKALLSALWSRSFVCVCMRVCCSLNVQQFKETLLSTPYGGIVSSFQNQLKNTDFQQE